MRSRFITTAPNADVFPDTSLPEIAFVGRSNVGKSSLLNRIAAAQIARTSKTPGRTQAVNFFEVAGRDFSFMLADLPGYGYARAPKARRREWYGLIEAYLTERVPLRAVMLLIDLRRGVETEDAEVFEWLEGEGGDGREILVVGTKCDKLSKAHRKPALRSIGEALGVPRERMLLSSSSNGDGIEILRDRLITLSDRGGPGA